MKRRMQYSGSAGALLLAAVAAACTVIGGERVEGWPALRIVEHRVPHQVMRDRCARYVGFGYAPEACAEFDFEAKRCDIWYSADFPPQSFIVEHERQHCLGYEHAGEHHMRRTLQAYEASRTQSASESSTQRNTR